MPDLLCGRLVAADVDALQLTHGSTAIDAEENFSPAAGGAPILAQPVKRVIAGGWFARGEALLPERSERCPISVILKNLQVKRLNQ